MVIFDNTKLLYLNNILFVYKKNFTMLSYDIVKIKYSMWFIVGVGFQIYQTSYNFNNS